MRGSRRRGALATRARLGAACACTCLCARTLAAQVDSNNVGRAPSLRDSATRVTSDSTLREWAQRLRVDSARAAGAPRVPVRCAGQTISDIVIVTQPPYANGLLGRFQFVARTVRSLHSTTRTEVVRRFICLLYTSDAAD